MLTSEEKEILDALKEHMDDEQKEALGEMSDEEKKEFVKMARKEIEKVKEDIDPDSITGRIKLIRQMSLWEFVRAASNGNGDLIGGVLFWLFIRMTATKKGCLTLLILVGVAVIAVVIAANLNQ